MCKTFPGALSIRLPKTLSAYLISSSLLFFTCTAIAEHHDNHLTEAEKKADWTLLFNGKDMSQWRNFKHDSLSPKWQIIDGAKVLSEKGGGDILIIKSILGCRAQCTTCLHRQRLHINPPANGIIA